MLQWVQTPACVQNRAFHIRPGHPLAPTLCGPVFQAVLSTRVEVEAGWGDVDTDGLYSAFSQYLDQL